MKNRDKPADPRNDAVEKGGLTKLEYATIHIAAAIARTHGERADRTANMRKAHALAVELFDEMDGGL